MQANQQLHTDSRRRNLSIWAIAASSILLSMLLPATGSAATAAGPANAATAPATAPVTSPAPAGGSAASELDLIKQTIEKRFPGAKVAKVAPSAIPGLFEVYTGSEIIYADAHADHVLMGPMIDTQTRTNLTEERLSDMGRVDFSTLPFNQAIKVVKGNGSRQFAVFSDPDCPFCQQLEKTLQAMNDYTMYVFLYPIDSLHPKAATKAHSIWCAKDRAAAWNDWMHDKKLPPTTTCAGDPVDQLQQFGNKLHINSTPTLFFASSKRVAGAIPQKDLETLLSAPAGKPAATGP